MAWERGYSTTSMNYITKCYGSVVRRSAHTYTLTKYKRNSPYHDYLSTSKICRVELCTELFDAIIRFGHVRLRQVDRR